MDDRSNSRELSERLELDFHRRPNRLRRMSYRAAGLLCLLTFAWLAFAFARGNNRVYEGGPVSTPHRLVANDCAACHTTWSTLERLTAFDPHVSTVDDAKCLSCHNVGLHHENQLRQHSRYDHQLVSANRGTAQTAAQREFIQGELRCAHCHREHQGRAALAEVTNQHCVECHRNLETTEGPSRTFVASIESFETANSPAAHPEFAWARLLSNAESSNAESPNAEPGTHAAAHQVYQVIQKLARDEFDQVIEPANAAGKWQDAARMRFNHHLHLKPGLIGPDLHPLAEPLQCSRCHEVDAAGRYMQPIQYEQHCAACHTLTFDVDAPGHVVPHETPELVRGFLTQHFTLKSLSPGEKSPAPDQEPSSVPDRPLPGRGRLTQTQAREVLRSVQQSEQAALGRSLEAQPEAPIAAGEARKSWHTELLFGNKAGCRYCHEVEPTRTSWNIVKPAIPDRWMPHSRFRHDIHRMLSCVSCHPGVGDSQSTGDVLLPAIDVCRKCHNAKSEFALLAPHHTLVHDGHDRAAARTNCVECHGYHSHVGQGSGGVYSWQPSSGDGE